MQARPSACHGFGPRSVALRWMPAITRVAAPQLDAAADVDAEGERHEDDERVEAQPAVDVEAGGLARRLDARAELHASSR